MFGLYETRLCRYRMRVDLALNSLLHFYDRRLNYKKTFIPCFDPFWKPETRTVARRCKSIRVVACFSRRSFTEGISQAIMRIFKSSSFRLFTIFWSSFSLVLQHLSFSKPALTPWSPTNEVLRRPHYWSQKWYWQHRTVASSCFQETPVLWPHFSYPNRNMVVFMLRTAGKKPLRRP